jgi:hypothetical protein
MNDYYLRQPQPANWQQALEERDGPGSHPSVVIYRSIDSSTPCSVLEPSKRNVFVQQIAAGQTAKTYGKVEDPLLMRDDERPKEVLVVVKRGAGVSYSENMQLPSSEGGEIREDNDGKTWKEIKAEQDARFNDDDDCCDDDDGYDDDGCGGAAGPRGPVLVDSYRHVDDYAWPPFHFQSQ